MSIQELNNIINWMVSKNINHLWGNKLVDKVERLFKNINAEQLFFKEHNSFIKMIKPADKKTRPSGYFYKHYHNGYCLKFCNDYEEGIGTSIRINKYRLKR